MHALVAAILLRVARLDPLDLDAEAEPPDRKLGEVEQGIGTCEGNAIVGADDLGQAELLERGFKYREGKRFPGAGQSSVMAKRSENSTTTGDFRRRRVQSGAASRCAPCQETVCGLGATGLDQPD